MTVIAYKDGVVACDSQSTQGNIRWTVRKFEWVGDTLLIGTGGLTQFLEVVQWYRDGANPADWPACQTAQDFSTMLAFTPEGVFEYEHRPFPIAVLDSFAAWGSGAAFAIGAMAVGASPLEAVNVAMEHCATCGRGAHVFDLRTLNDK